MDGWMLMVNILLIFTSSCTIGEANSGNLPNSGNCPPLKSTTVDFTCKRHDARVSCTSDILENTTAIPKCKNYHITRPEVRLKSLTCENGKWDRTMPYCIPKCGDEMPSGLSKKEFRSPWHVGIYRKHNDDMDNICGGTILTNKIVVTGAICVTNVRNGINNFPPDDFGVGAGKFYRSWNHAEDNDLPFVQKVSVEKIIVPDGFGGSEMNYQSDIALLVLKKLLHFSINVHPICSDLHSTIFKNQLISPGTIGKVAGWGVTKEGDINSVSETLQVFNLPIVDSSTCIKNLVPSLRRYLTSDKICVGFRNGTAPCSGTSGGGLMFSFNDGTTEIWYIRGIVSVSDSDDTGSTCRMNEYTLFTNLIFYEDFILDTLETYVKL